MRLIEIHPALPDWPLVLVIAGWVLFVSLVLFICYGYDKRQAEKGGQRIPEARLHGFALLGGWPGGLLGQQWFRHKTRKLSFQWRFWLIGVLQGLLLTAWVWPEPFRLLAREFLQLEIF